MAAPQQFTGTVKFFDPNKKFGFIIIDNNGGDVYFSAAGLPRDASPPQSGERVQFTVRESRTLPDRKNAFNIRVIGARGTGPLSL